MWATGCRYGYPLQGLWMILWITVRWLVFCAELVVVVAVMSCAGLAVATYLVPAMIGHPVVAVASGGGLLCGLWMGRVLFGGWRIGERALRDRGHPDR
jgi:hypothetical protein